MEFSVLELLSTDTAHPSVDAAGIVDVARAVERAGYRRIWYAEHHDSMSMIPFPPAVVVARVASATSAIRVGSGGVLAVNHAPISLAEQFEALTGFFPGRIDLGIDRGPGTFVEETARALRQGRDPATEDEYAGNVAEILRLAGEHPAPAQPWLLASSPAGAAVAAKFGLPMAFAHRLRPQNTAESVERRHRAWHP
jgi:luciferase family oxidoreductase group 1